MAEKNIGIHFPLELSNNIRVIKQAFYGGFLIKKLETLFILLILEKN